MKLNTAPRVKRPAAAAAPVAETAAAMKELRRSVACCLLWEDAFYESGEDSANRIVRLVPQCPVEFVHAVAIEARKVHGLRHVPLLLARELARRPEGHVAELLPQVITRADQLGEFVALYMKSNGGKRTLSAQVKKGLARAFANFDAYALAKNDHQRADWSLKDVAKLVHARKGKDPLGFTGEQYRPETKRGLSAPKTRGSVLEQLCLGTLPTPDTWEVELSKCHTPEAKRAVWERLLTEEKLGGLAWLRNLRNMNAVGVDHNLIRQCVPAPARLSGILPHQVLTAAKHNPWAEGLLGGVLAAASEGLPQLPGRTLVLVDVSGSMARPLTRNSETTRLEAAYGLAIHAQAVCERAVVATFSDTVVVCAGEVPGHVIKPAYGFELRDRMNTSQRHSGTYISATLRVARDKFGTFDRTLLITDGESSDGIAPPLGRGYEMNVAAYERGVGGTDWVTISGWSPKVLPYILAAEEIDANA